ncbi:MAG: ATP-binding protein [Nitrospinota bacterium]
MSSEDAGRIRDLEARLEHLEEVNRWTLETLDMVSSINDFQSVRSGGRGAGQIMAEPKLHLKRLIPFEAMAFFTVNEEDQGFTLADCEPGGARPSLQREADRLIEDGTFAWSLFQFRAVMVPAEDGEGRLLLHVITTRSRTRGMFLGFLPPGAGNVYDATLNLLSVVLLNCAHALESYELYKALQETYLSLEKAVDDRTRELLVARDHAEEANRAKTEFLSNMNHELRSPLNAVIGFSDVIMLNSQDPETVSLAGKIKDAGKYLAHLIEDLLDLDRIEIGGVRLDLQEIPLNRLIASTVETQIPNLRKGFSLECSLDPACGPVLCDPTRLRQVLLNLLDNAVKYSPGGGAIRVRTWAEGGEVRVSVQDQGLGIAPEHQKTVFERFRQLESGHRRRAGGLGIGLSLAQRLLALHGGRIWVESEVGEGSTFTFALPTLQAAQAAGAPAPAEGAAQEPAEPWSGRRVLVVDDVEDYHKLMKLLMRQASRILSAFDGQEAVEMARKEKPEIILMDLRMPVLDGFEAISRIKAEPDTGGIPILGVSAQVMKEDRERCLRAGAEGYITKPIDLDALRLEIKRVLR